MKRLNKLIDILCIVLVHFISLALQTASKTLMEAIADVYESQWTGADAVTTQVQQIDTLWQDFSHKLGDQVLLPLNTYTAQFPEMKVSDADTLPPQKGFPPTNFVLCPCVVVHRKK